jgi:adenine-specific DNA-methyltransferase
MTKEEKFFDALRDVFVGAKVEGESGYINLMKIKSRYYTEGVFPQLQKDIKEALKPFPAFRDELFEKLYDFFHRYFSESGSIYFRYTPLHQNVYEKVYTDDKDVMLFWKTHMLYYVKTDRLFKSLEVELEGQKFFFDVSTLEHKKANEKRDIVYTLKEKRKDGALVFTVAYSERGRQTKTDDILRAVRHNGDTLKENTLERAFRVFEKQSEVDYFINKDAKAFLEEQFNLWLYQYVFSGVSEWTETRIKQLQTLRNIAFKIIAFISQFENELVKIWNKPKFVLNSNYVVTLDRIADKKGGLAVVEKLLAHKNFKAQVEEWQELGIAGKSFKKADVLEKNGKGYRLAKAWQYLPVDTKHFKDVELKILGLFDNLDAELDGWIIQSDNYQALKTIQSKFRERVQCVHIDPPYNTETSGFLYKNAYQHSSWLTMMENRIKVALPLLPHDGAFVCHIDENECERLQLLCTEMGVPDAGTLVWDKKNPMLGKRGVATQHEYVLWRTYVSSPIYLRSQNVRVILDAAKSLVQKHGEVNEEVRREFAAWIDNCEGLSGGERAYRLIDEDGRVFQSVAMGAPEPRTDPKFFIPLIHPVTKKKCPVPSNGWSRAPATLKILIEKGEILFGKDETVQPRRKVFLTQESKRQLPSVISDASRGKQDLEKLGLEFPYCHPVSLYEELQGAGTPDSDDIILDHFAGSGTSAHALINLNREDGGKRKYILVEMAQYRGTVILPRIKKVVFSDGWSDGEVQKSGQGISHFCKYYDMEQYEDALRKARYAEADLFDDPNKDAYHQYVFLRDPKMLEALEVDTKKNAVKLDLSKLYDGIDIAETLSNLTGKWIKHISVDSVEFEDGEVVDTKNLDWKPIKPLIWW